MLAQPGRLSQTDLIAAIDNGTIDTVINAIVDAMGAKRHIDMPATPERVWRVLDELRAA